MPGVGKSYFGKKFSEIANYKFYDLDLNIEKNCKMKVSEIFETKGEKYFRKKEAEILKKTVETSVENTVIATGGGTPLHSNLMQYMNEAGITVWLISDINYIISNIKSQKNARPMFNNSINIREKLNELYKQRHKTYAKSMIQIVINEGTCPNLFTNTLLLSTIAE